MKTMWFVIAALLLAACAVTPQPPAALPLATATAPAPGEPPPRATAFMPAYVPPPTQTPWFAPTHGPPWATGQALWTRTPAPPPTIVPPIVTPPAGQLPPLTHDVFFVDVHGALLRWDHAGGRLAVVATPQPETATPWSPESGVPQPGSVQQFVVSTDGSRAVVLRKSTVGMAYELIVLDLVTGQLTRLGAPTDSFAPWYMALTPDGQWLAYVQWGASGQDSGRLYALPLDRPDRRIEVAYCAESYSASVAARCAGFAWAPDNRTLAWSDAGGIWLAEPGQAPRLLEPLGSGGQGTNAPLQYAIQAWSPDGRRLLLGAAQNGALRVLDVRTGRAANVPWAGGALAGSLPAAAWTPDGRLFVAGLGERRFAGSVWRVDAQDPALVVRDASFDISPVTSEAFVAGAAVFPDGRMAFALGNSSATAYEERGLYVVEPPSGIQTQSGQPRKVNGLPPAGTSFDMTISWAPDGSGALVYVQRDPAAPLFLYALMGGAALYDLLPFATPGLIEFVWAP
jgi:hypothetical protein